MYEPGVFARQNGSKDVNLFSLLVNEFYVRVRAGCSYSATAWSRITDQEVLRDRSIDCFISLLTKRS